MIKTKELIFLTLLCITLASCASVSWNDKSDYYNDVEAIDSLYKSLSTIPPNDPSASFFLVKHANELPTLFRYELARRYQLAGMHSQALIEVAHARLVRDMELELCKDKQHSRPKNTIAATDMLETWIHGSDKMKDPLWMNAIDQAFKKDVTTHPVWLCGKDNIDMSFGAITKSKRRFNLLKEDFERIKGSPQPG